jgi:hypothetical protein
MARQTHAAVLPLFGFDRFPKLFEPPTNSPFREGGAYFGEEHVIELAPLSKSLWTNSIHFDD